MTLILAAALILTISGFLILLDRKDAREREERQTLLQRIQAPQAAVHEHHSTVAPAEPSTDHGMPMSDAEIAEMQGHVPDAEAEKQKLIAWMEAVENGTAQMQDGVIP